MANYSYLADGTRTSAVGSDGSGLVRRGSLTYRKAADGSLEFEGADFGARHYSPALTRWLTPDPLSEKYYGISPYAYCNGDPVNLVDKDGRFPETIWDVTSLVIGVKSFVDNVQSGNVGGAIADGIGIVADAAAVALPFVPGGAGAGIKAYRAADKAADIVRTVNKVDNATDAVSAGKNAAKVAEETIEAGGKEAAKTTSRGTLRQRMIKSGGDPGPGMEAHHTLPVKFQEEFTEAGIDINAVDNGRWLEGHSHKSTAFQYNKEWEGFFKRHRDAGTKPTKKDIYQFRDNLMKTMYGK